MATPQNKKSIPGFSKSISVPPRLSKSLFAEFEVGLSQAVLKNRPNDLETLNILGNALTRVGRHEEALEIDRKIASMLPNEPTVFYNISCDLSNLGRLDESLEYLRKALQLGYNDFEFIDKDPDMANLRSLPKFTKLISRYKNIGI